MYGMGEGHNGGIDLLMCRSVTFVHLLRSTPQRARLRCFLRHVQDDQGGLYDDSPHHDSERITFLLSIGSTDDPPPSHGGADQGASAHVYTACASIMGPVSHKDELGQAQS